MSMQPRESDSSSDFRHREESTTSGNLLKAAGIGVGIYVLFRLLRKILLPGGPAIPPIIIKSFDDESEPIQIESVRILQEQSIVQEHTNTPAGQKQYTMSKFGKVLYVNVSRRDPDTGDWDDTPYSDTSGAGFEVKLWLQQPDQNGQWNEEPNGPHLVVMGSMNGFSLRCEQLTPSGFNPDPFRLRKRLFKKNNKKWRIGRVIVGTHPEIKADGYDRMDIAFDDAPE